MKPGSLVAAQCNSGTLRVRGCNVIMHAYVLGIKVSTGFSFMTSHSWALVCQAGVCGHKKEMLGLRQLMC